MATTGGIILIVGKAAIWLLIPLMFALWELRRHRKLMAHERTEIQSLPGRLRAPNNGAPRGEEGDTPGVSATPQRLPTPTAEPNRPATPEKKVPEVA